MGIRPAPEIFAKIVSNGGGSGFSPSGTLVKADTRHQDGLGFAFGQQTQVTRGADTGKKIAVIGGGDVYSKVVRPTLLQRAGEGTEIFVCDPGSPKGLSDNTHSAESIIKGGIDALPEDVDFDYVLILTPPSTHLDIIKEAFDRGIPVLVEKPIVGNVEELDQLSALIEKSDTPLYCIDWEFMHSIPLLTAVLDESVTPFHDIVNFDGDADVFQSFDFDNLARVEARMVESGFLGDVKGRGGWVDDINRGGGMLYDMLVHKLAVLSLLGFKMDAVEDTFLGDSVGTGQHGQYKHISAANDGEMYGWAHVKMKTAQQQDLIDTYLEVGKAGAENDGFIEFTDGSGKVLRYDVLPEDDGIASRDSLLDEDGQQLVSAHMMVDCYSLVLEHASRLLDPENAASQDYAHFFYEQAEAFRAIHEIHQHARDRAQLEKMHGVERSQLALKEPQ